MRGSVRVLLWHDVSVEVVLGDTDVRRPAARLVALAWFPVGCVLVVLAAVLAALSTRYGYHRDEFYFLAAGDHLDWGYVDQPPLTPLLAKLGTTLFGDTLPGLRVVPLVVSLVTTWTGVLIARELGGGRGAQTLAAVCFAGSGLALAGGHALSTVTVDMLAWLVVIWLVLRLLRTGDPRWYLAIGAAVGIGLQNKYLVGMLVVALLAGVLAVGPRQCLRSWWLPAGAVVALVIVAPNIVWQAAHGWPQLAMADEIEVAVGAQSRTTLLPLQLLYVSPFLLPIWVVGLVRLWRDPAVRWARSLVVAYPVLLVLMLVTGGKPYYSVPLIGAVLVAGTEPVVRWARTGARRALLAGAVTLAVVSNAVVALPVLPPRAVAVIGAINPDAADQVGWPELLSAVRSGWSRVPPEQRSRAVIFTEAYGEAGAIDRLGPAMDLPRAYSGHMGYGDFGHPPDSANGPVLLVKNRQVMTGERLFVDCRPVTTVDNGLGVRNYLQGATVSLCQRISVPWSVAWPRLRHLYLASGWHPPQ
jgi:hypothetical protein